MTSRFSFLAFVGVMFLQTFAWSQAKEPIYILHIRLGNKELRDQVEFELTRSLSSGKQGRKVEVIVPDLNTPKNPFGVTFNDFDFGHSRPPAGKPKGETPLLKNIEWFQNEISRGRKPDVLIINGHHVPALGFHSDTAHSVGDLRLWDKSLHLMTLFKSIEAIPEVKEYFSKIKLVFVGGCYGLANFEPKSDGISGRHLNESEIKYLYQTNQIDKLLGKGQYYVPYYGLQAQWQELSTVYSYVTTPQEETCRDMENRTACHHYNVRRILPMEGLWDGSHMFNTPWLYKRAFPGAFAVIGFNTPSPRTPGYIWKATFDGTRASLKEKGYNYTNFLQPLFDSEVNLDTKKEIISTLRTEWTEHSYLQNRGRTSGSITPAFPELDKNGIFSYSSDFKGKRQAEIAPYEAR